MGVNDTWVSPAAAGVLDLATGGTVTEAVWDAVISDLLHLGGTTGLVPGAVVAADGGTSFTPTLGQTVAVTCTVNNARYYKLGKHAVLQISLTATSAGSAGGSIDVGSIPAAVAPQFVGGIAGVWECYDTGTTYYGGTARFGNSSTVAFHRDAVGNSFGNGDMTLANGDVLQVSLAYETAS